MVGTAAQATIAATGLAAAEVWRLRTRREQAVAVDMRHAAVEFRSERYMRLDGRAPGPAWDKIAGVYTAGDGRKVRLHTNFPHHRDGILKLLGCAYDRAAVERALLKWQAEPFETAAAEAGAGGHHAAVAGGVGGARPGAGGRGAAAHGDHQDRRGAAGPAAAKPGATAVGGARARPHACHCRAGVRPRLGSARCGRDARDGAASAGSARSRHRHRARQAVRRHRPARHRRSRLAARPGTGGAHPRAGLSARADSPPRASRPRRLPRCGPASPW